MDPWKHRTVTHRDHDLMNPLPEEALEEALDRAALRPGARVLDVACGKGRLLLRAMERGAGSGVGVELSPDFAAEARARLAGRAVRILEMDGAALPREEGGFDLAACLGASWIWGGNRGMLRALAARVRPGGAVLAMEPFWRLPPDPAYLASQRLRADEFGTQEDNLADAVAEGLTLLWSRESTAADWDRYEGLQRDAAEAFARENPGDPDGAAILARARASYADHERWGRRGVGDSVCLFRFEGR